MIDDMPPHDEAPDESGGEGENEAPPKFDPRTLARRQDAAVASADSESMPVLAAFQEFLEAERLRSRQRMIWISVAFGVTLVIFLTAATIIGVKVLKPMQQEVTSLQTQVDVYERQSARAADRVAGMTARLREQDRRLQTQLAAERQAHAATRTALNNRQAGVTTNLLAVQSVVRKLQRENARLQQGMAYMQADLPDLLGDVRDTLRGLKAGQAAPATASPLPSTAPPSPPPAAATTETTPLDLTITPQGSRKSLKWRLIVPE